MPCLVGQSRGESLTPTLSRREREKLPEARRQTDENIPMCIYTKLKAYHEDRPVS